MAGVDLSMWMKTLSVAQVLVLTRFALMAVEMALIRLDLVRGHFMWKDTLASIGMRAGNYATNVMLAGVTAVVFAFFYQFRLFDIPMNSVYARAAMFRDVWHARSAREVVRYIFGPPGWRPDGNGATAANIRAAWRATTANA